MHRFCDYDQLVAEPRMPLQRRAIQLLSGGRPYTGSTPYRLGLAKLFGPRQPLAVVVAVLEWER